MTMARSKPDRGPFPGRGTLPAVILLVTCLWLPSTGWTHPHVSVDIQVTPRFDSDGSLTAFEQSWRFDTFYSVVLMEEIEREGPGGKDRLLEDIIDNLSRHDFYTRVQVNGERLPTADVDGFDLEANSRTVEFRFTLPLLEPVSSERLREHGFSYQVYEPTYYIEMLHAETDGIRLHVDTEHCRYEMESPEPSAEHLQRAVEVDERGVPEDPDLGQHFAETVFVRCD